MLDQLIIGAFMLVFSVIFQALAFEIILKKTHALMNFKIIRVTKFWKAFVLATVTLGVATTLITEIWVWGAFYYFVGAVSDWEEALYFSASAFTTVGFGDIYLDKEWRLLSSMESMHGFLLFGWSTAFIFEVVSNVYKKEGKQIKGK